MSPEPVLAVAEPKRDQQHAREDDDEESDQGAEDKQEGLRRRSITTRTGHTERSACRHRRLDLAHVSPAQTRPTRYTDTTASAD